MADDLQLRRLLPQAARVRKGFCPLLPNAIDCPSAATVHEACFVSGDISGVAGLCRAASSEIR
jgi:hypothetical protein